MRMLKHLGECAAGVVRCRTAFRHICGSVHVWAAEWRPLSSRTGCRLGAPWDTKFAPAFCGQAMEQGGVLEGEMDEPASVIVHVRHAVIISEKPELRVVLHGNV